MMARLCAALLLVSGIVLPTMVGLMQPGYTIAPQYLSELGATGAPNATLIKYAGFLPTALALAGCLIALHARLPRARLVTLGLIGIGTVCVSYLGAVIYPCDTGCPAGGSFSQTMHNLLGIVGYLGSIVGLALVHQGIRASASPFVSGLTLGALVLSAGGFLLMAMPELAPLRGAMQRVADFSLFLWAAGLVTMLRPKTPNTINHQTGDNEQVSGMTVNERLFHLGLIEDFDTAVSEGDFRSARRILEASGLDDAQIDQILNELFP